MYIVNHYNFGLHHYFETLAEAKAWTVKANFDASLIHNGETIARYSSIGGWR